MKPLILYHANCWDGFCAAWVARMALGDIEAVPVQYGQPPPTVTDRHVYLLDFCYPRPQMRHIAGEAKALVVLDHHKTAREALDGFVDECVMRPDLVRSRPGQELVRVHFDMEKSGGRLAWEHFAYLGGWQGMASPWLVDYTEDRDLWRHRLEDSEAVNAALRSYPLDFNLWDDFAKQHPTDFTREGEAIRRREKQIVNDHVRNARVVSFSLLAGGPVTADELCVPVVNATTMFSEIAGELAKGHPFAACYFDRQDGKRQWSLRSAPDGVDVSEIAKAHGGGGHPHAAGFEQ